MDKMLKMKVNRKDLIQTFKHYLGEEQYNTFNYISPSITRMLEWCICETWKQGLTWKTDFKLKIIKKLLGE